MVFLALTTCPFLRRYDVHSPMATGARLLQQEGVDFAGNTMGCKRET